MIRALTIRVIASCMGPFCLFIVDLAMASPARGSEITNEKAISYAQSVIASSEPISVPAGTVKKSLPFVTGEITDFSPLLGQSSLPSLVKKATLTLYQPSGQIVGVVLMSPSSEGVRNLMVGQHVRHFLTMKYAVLMVDSYRIRGNTEVLHDQAAVSFPSQVLDILLAIKQVQNMAQFAHLPLGLFGSSRGGMTVMFALDQRVLKTMGITVPPSWACVLYPPAFLSYDPSSIKPVAPLPVLYVIAAQDDEVSPKQSIQYAHSMGKKNPQFHLIIWPHAVHLFDAPFAKFWLSTALSGVNLPLVLVDDKGYFIFNQQRIKSWAAVNVFWKKYISQGIHIGYTNDSNKKIFRVIKHFIIQHNTSSKGNPSCLPIAK